MKIRHQIAFLAVVFLLIAAIGGIGIYTSSTKRLLKLERSTQATWGDLEWRLEERNQFLASVLAYARPRLPGREEQYRKVEESRDKLSALIRNGSPVDVIQQANELEGRLAGIFVVLENTPQIKAEPEFRRLREKYSEIQNRLISFEVQYNEAAGQFNRFIQGFSGRFLARREVPKPVIPVSPVISENTAPG
jgi:LemA protein